MDDGKDLILQAFDQAKLAGKSDWYRMTTAVLKNRLLSLTYDEFDEAQYGVPTFTGFLERHSDVIDLDRTSFPPVVELRNIDSGKTARPRRESPAGRPRVRSDLWRAALDYSSGTRYVWDEMEEQARPARPDEDGPAIPTVSQDLHEMWREEFVADIESIPLSPDQEEQVSTWIQHKLPAAQLPRHLVGQWNGFLRDKVHSHLVDWFEEYEMDPPDDLLSTVPIERPAHSSSDTEDLRHFVIRTVKEMSGEELGQLSLPSRAVFRASRSHR